MVSLSPNDTPKSHILILSALLFVTILGSGYFYLNLTSPSSLKQISFTSLRNKMLTTKPTIIEDTSAQIEEPTPSIVPLPTGLQSYEFTHGAQVVGPKVAKIIYDPLTPSAGGTQKVTLTAAYSAPITDVVLTIVSDHLITPHTLSLTSGTTTDGTWTGSWVIDDTLDTRYAARTTLKSTKDTHDSAMWFRNQ